MSEDRIQQLEAEAAAMREALVELLKHPSDNSLYATATEDGYTLTPWQRAERRAKAALSADAGRDLLERLKQVESERDEAQRIINLLLATNHVSENTLALASEIANWK